MKPMHAATNKLKLAGIFLLFVLLAAARKPDPARAAEKLELNKAYTVEIGDDALLYEFSVPEAGNIHIQVQSSDPTVTRNIEAQLYDSNNRALISIKPGPNLELPVYSSDGRRGFYLKVRDCEVGHAPGCAYYLTVGFQPTTDWETEPNDTTASADAISQGNSWYGTITDYNEGCDYFKFKLDRSKKVSITFGPKEVSGTENEWDVFLIDSNNRSVQIYKAGTTETYTCYLKKGTYNIKVESHNSAAYDSSAVNVPYAMSYKESEINLAKPVITSIAAGQEGAYSYVNPFRIKIKNLGDATGYKVKVSYKKNMGKPVTIEEIDFDEENTKKQVTFHTRISAGKSFYAQAKSYVTDPFGTKIYGKYGSVRRKTLS